MVELINMSLKLYDAMQNFHKYIGTTKARRAIQTATAINNYRTNNLATYGESYRKTFEYARLELGEKIALFKYELFKSLFRIKGEH